jgi:hypothetical protein
MATRMASPGRCGVPDRLLACAIAVPSVELGKQTGGARTYNSVDGEFARPLEVAHRRFRACAEQSIDRPGLIAESAQLALQAPHLV